MSFSIGGNLRPKGLKGFEWTARLVEWSDDIGPKMAQWIRDEAPVDTGRLRDSIRYRRSTTSDGVKMEFVPGNVPYAEFVIKGTAPHDIYPVAGMALHWMGGSAGDVFAAFVHHPGTKPNNFPQRAMDTHSTEISSSFREHLAK